MSASFYGGQRGYSFLFRSNPQNDGKWIGVGSVENPEENTLCYGIKENDLKLGDYAVVSDEETSATIYRIGLTRREIIVDQDTQYEEILLPFEIATLPLYSGLPGADGGVSQWYKGTAISGDQTQTYILSNSDIGDGYFNIETGDVYVQEAQNSWTYKYNLKGPVGPTGEGVNITYRSTPPSQTNPHHITLEENLNLLTLFPIDCEAIKVRQNGVGGAFTTKANSNNCYYYDFSDATSNATVYFYLGGTLPPCIFVKAADLIYINNQSLTAGVYLLFPIQRTSASEDVEIGLVRVIANSNPSVLWVYYDASSIQNGTLYALRELNYNTNYRTSFSTAKVALSDLSTAITSAPALSTYYYSAATQGWDMITDFLRSTFLELITEGGTLNE